MPLSPIAPMRSSHNRSAAASRQRTAIEMRSHCPVLHEIDIVSGRHKLSPYGSACVLQPLDKRVPVNQAGL